jgi:hypothetical protein
MEQAGRRMAQPGTAQWRWRGPVGQGLPVGQGGWQRNSPEGGGLHGEAAMATSGGGVPALAGVPVIGGGRREVLHHRGKEE